MNRIVLIGRLVKEVGLKYTPAGIAVANMRIAVDRPFKNDAGERETDFIDLVAWRKLAEVCANNLQKGRLIAVEGRLQIRPYQTQDGQKRQAAEVVCDNVQFLDRKKDEQNIGDEADLSEDDIPF